MAIMGGCASVVKCVRAGRIDRGLNAPSRGDRISGRPLKEASPPNCVLIADDVDDAGLPSPPEPRLCRCIVTWAWASRRQ